MEITFISDTHQFHRDDYEKSQLTSLLPGGPIIVHSGDMSGRGGHNEILEFLGWFDSLNYTHKILIAGNHDFMFDVNPEMAHGVLSNYPGITYLNESGVVIEGIKFWGSPITLYFHNWAFNRHPHEIAPHWEKIPDDVDVLITHGPPFGILDKTHYGKIQTGCPILLEKIKKIKPQVHAFGHIHEARGTVQTEDTLFINASTVDLRYNLYDMSAPFKFDINPKKLVQ